MIICNQCGNAMKDNLRFCTECGAEMPGFASPVAPPTVPSYMPPQPQPAQYAPSPAPTIYAEPERRSNTLPWLLVPLCLLLVAVVGVIGLRSSQRIESPAGTNSNSNANVNYNAGGGANRNAAAPSSKSSPNGRIAVCKFTPVHVRDAPRLDAAIIADINTDQRVRVISQSSNYDTVFVRSLNRSVSDNWSEIEVENTSIHGWVFSGFLE
jgi:hypothetical protein